MSALQENNNIFFGLSAEQLKILNSYSKEIHLSPGEILAKEGEEETTFYYILSGQVGVFKKNTEGKSHLLTLLGKNSVLGEMAIIDNKPRSATLIAQEQTDLLSFNIHDVKQHNDIYSVLAANIGVSLSNRLRYTNDITIKSMEKALVEESRRVTLAAFTELVLTTLALFTISIGLIRWLHALFINTNLVSTFLLYICIIPLVIYITKSKLPKKMFGLTFENAWPDTVRSLLWSVPVIAAIVLIKWLALHYSVYFQGDRLFEPTAEFRVDHIVLWQDYFLSLIAYVTTCPAQEIIVRGCLQGSLYTFSAGSERRRQISAILISNLIFSAFHVHTSAIFALIVFVTGLFWGWLYSKQKSIIGVSVSHIIIGVWAAFILGIHELFVGSN